MLEKDFDESGLSTTEALNRLQKDIEQVLNQFNLSQRARKSKSWIRDALHHCSQHTTINWISALAIVTVLILMIISYVVNQNNAILLYQAIIVLFLLTVCVAVELCDNNRRHNEIPRRVKALLTQVKNEMNKISWTPESYPHLLSPFSPCITLQWTYRDNKLINLPWALLVKDDVILIRPGQISPGYCESLDKNAEYALLHAKEVYGPTLQNANEFFSTPKSRRPLENKKYRLLETPYLNNLRIALEQALDRPVTVQNQQRHFVMIKIIERILLPLVLVLILIINCIKYKYLEVYIGASTWLDLFFLTPIATILPLLPLVFPVVWNGLNYLGMARFKAIFDKTSHLQHTQTLFEDHDNSQVSNYKLEYHCREVWTNFLDILKGQENMMVRSANILHVLGSLTALCCVDKKGILSWPNPTAEKVFFLHNTDSLSQASSLANLGELSTDADSLRGTTDSINNNDGYLMTVPEVLDLTHDQNDPFRLHFDDTTWHKHLNSLKPLGLAILLNTCNLSTQENYTKFCSHITCEAMYNENLVPVTNRRCLCELAKEIGFLDQAQKIFSLEQQLSSFRHLQTEMARRDNKYARSLHLSTKLKFPFPHMFAVVVKELSSGSMQLLTQGTADIILDSCIDYWDGHDLCTLSHSDRKKIQDFYQRSSLTAYCTAFAYRPLYKGVSDKLSQMYLELPSDSRHLYLNHRSPTPVHCECRPVLEPRIKTPIGQFYSTDSLLYNDSPGSDVSDIESCFEMQCNQVFIGMVTMQYQAQLDMVHLIEQLERACIRFVHFSKENELRSRVFSEKMGLESGWNCHISLLSERSRRESGPTECWANNGTARVSSPADLPRRVGVNNARKLNSPTSDARPILDNDSTLDSSKALSYSAPSAINLEHSVVKFDMEREPLTKYPCDQTQDAEHHGTSQDSVHFHGIDINSTSHEWQSLSCLTDSTEQSAPINFDMSNRAKLPRGIDKIRPHIENIDNVPLLVSLFTDCTATSTKEMIHIMQDYGEVICVVGSSANYETAGVFMQADASIAVEPLYPQVCQKMETYSPVETDSISPIDLSRALNSVACSLSIRREDPLSIIYLIVEARHYMSLLLNTVQFWLCSCIAVSIMQLAAALLMLPALLTIGQVLWICCVIIPIISISLIGTSADSEIMKKAQGKKQIGFNWEVFIFVLWCYGIKFLPMILIVIISYAGTLASYCTDICLVQNCTCNLFYLPSEQLNSTLVTDWSEHSSSIPSAQHFCVILILLHLMTISVGFVHRDHSIWNKSPHDNFLWLSSFIILLVLQMVFTLLSMSQTAREYNNSLGFQIGNLVIIFAFLSPFVTFAINELIKKEEIKANLRYQRRARLDFGTKLGMNSPF